MTLVVKEILGSSDEAGFAGREHETVVISSEPAQRRRLRTVTSRGRDIALDLPRGSFLFEGAVLHDDGTAIVVVERGHEDALVIALDSSLSQTELIEQAARVAHWAGNQHLLVETDGYELRVRAPAGSDALLSAARSLELPGAELRAASVPFTLRWSPRPIGG
jgi:urease accessory protein